MIEQRETENQQAIQQMETEEKIDVQKYVSSFLPSRESARPRFLSGR